MTNREALAAFARNERLDQPTIRRLLEVGLITASDVTNMRTPPGQKEYLPIAMTLKGQRVLENGRSQRQKKSKNKSWYKRLRQRVPRVEIKAAFGIILTLLGLCLTYKYTGADDLRNKVYRPINADLEKLQGAVSANSVNRLFYGDALNALKESGDFYRIPKSLQTDISKLYEDEAQYEANITPVTELLEREFSSRIQSIRSEKSDREWSTETEYRLRVEEQQKQGVSAISGFTATHSARGRGIDVRDPNHPIACIPGGPIWEINDWLSYPENLNKVDALWTDEDFLYLDDSRDMWYYRITRADLEKEHKTLKDFLEPVRDILSNDSNFKNIQTRQPEVLQRLATLKAKIADRMDDPKRLRDIFD